MQSSISEGLLTTKMGAIPRNSADREDTRMGVKLPRINFPYFNGEGPREWLRKAQKYFQIH